MRILPSFLLFTALLLFLFGCMQSGVPRACQGVSQDRVAPCTYVSAVMEQNPFQCYSIGDQDWRKICISDSSNPAMQKRVGAMTEEEKYAVFQSPTPVAAKPAPAPPAPATSPNTTIVPPTKTQNQTDSNASVDQRLYDQAVASNNILLCEEISVNETLKSCLSQVARQTKMPALCEALSTKDNIEICRMYSQGGDVKG